MPASDYPVAVNAALSVLHDEVNGEHSKVPVFFRGQLNAVLPHLAAEVGQAVVNALDATHSAQASHPTGAPPNG